jgi:uncharacterized membrane protein
MAVSEFRDMTLEEQSLRTLVKQLGNDASLLVRQEVELARREIEEKLSKARKELMALAAGAALAYVGLLGITAGVILVLSLTMAAWLAALIVGAGLVLAGGALVLIGKYGLGHLDPMPRRAIQSVRTDFRTIQHAAR